MTRPTATPRDAKPALTPNLRFPEFRDGPGWDGKPMGEVYSFKGNNSLSRDKLNYEHGTVKNLHYGDIHTKFATLFDITKEPVPFISPAESLDGLRAENYCVEGDMVFADASEDLEDIGKSIELVRLNGERVVSGLHTILARPGAGELALGFGAYLFKSKRVRVQIQKESQGAKVLGISATRLTKIQLPIPPTKAEQQKIAECLSTLDELIGAEGQKLDALKAHQKGLMQQLFPRESETIPRLRFPEFHSAPGWTKKKIGRVVTPVVRERDKPSTAYTGLGLRSHGKGTFLKNAENPDKNSMEVLFEVKCDDLILNITFAWEGAVAIAKDCDDGALVSHRFPTFTINTEESIPGFLRYVILDKQFVYNLGVISPGGAGRNRVLNKRDFLGLSFLLPGIEEQKHIATCLSSLDDLIAARSERLAALETHKQGLLQQLFPSPAAASA
ncbi:MAG: EcoKI restriction-modification system protein HsdS [Verrucomicrobia bacterium ADurb.Bin345]|nr:MAG: EcoKI restriction-modification system protein HsdS [Verrucomicrobia bacterium ADurb.Bin345]